MVVLALCSPAYAQFGGLLDRAQKAKKAKQKFDELNITEEEEIKIGADVSVKIRDAVRRRAGSGRAQVRDAGRHGARRSRPSGPKLPWTFIVLDTDGVNAFAVARRLRAHHARRARPDHERSRARRRARRTRSAHVAHKHTVNAIRKNKAVQLGTSETLPDRGPFLDKIANKAYDMVLENKFDRGDELDADKGGVALAEKAGYAPGALADFLTRLDERNKDQPARNGLFASHPETKERIDKIRKMAGTKTGALVEARYKQNIKYEPTPITSIAAVPKARRA